MEHLGTLLQQAVNRRLMSEVPLGAFLSGGLDSSTVVALMARASAKPVKTFAIGFDETNYSELDDARVVAQHLGTEHHEMIVKPAALDILPELVWHLDEPFGDSSAVPTYYVCRAARQHVTVALSGDGGDEVFAGYARYRQIDHYRRALGAEPGGNKTAPKPPFTARLELFVYVRRDGRRDSVRVRSASVHSRVNLCLVSTTAWQQLARPRSQRRRNT